MSMKLSIVARVMVRKNCLTECRYHGSQTAFLTTREKMHRMYSKRAAAASRLSTISRTVDVTPDCHSENEG